MQRLTCQRVEDGGPGINAQRNDFDLYPGNAPIEFFQTRPRLGPLEHQTTARSSAAPATVPGASHSPCRPGNCTIARSTSFPHVKTRLSIRARVTL